MDNVEVWTVSIAGFLGPPIQQGLILGITQMQTADVKHREATTIAMVEMALLLLSQAQMVSFQH